VPLTFHKDGPNGPHYVRPVYKPADYTVHPTTVRAITNHKLSDLSIDMMLKDPREGPFEGWDVVGRFQRDGRQWVRLRQVSAEYCVDVAVTRVGFGEFALVDPLVAYNLALELDKQRDYPVVYEK
jgi:hypothetical protein